MTQRSFFWNGIIVGDAATYTEGGKGYHASVSTHDSPLCRMFRALWNGNGNRGVLYGWTNELEVTGAATPITIDTGAAIVYGLYYENTSAITKAISTPTVARRYDRVVVRRDWAAQTARIHVITGMENGSVPSLTQGWSTRTTYDIPLATLLVETDGTITITDNREYCTYSTMGTTTSRKYTTANIANDSITLSQRKQKTKSFFLGGGDLVVDVVPGKWTRHYCDGGQYVGPCCGEQAVQSLSLVTQSGPPEFGGAADIKAWKSDATTYGGVYASFCLPGDFVEEANTLGMSIIPSYIWVINNATTATSATIYSSYHVRSDGSMYASGRVASSLSASTANSVHRVAGVTMYGASASFWTGNGLNIELDRDRMFHYRIWTTGISGSESIGILGIEFRYTGYT